VLTKARQSFALSRNKFIHRHHRCPRPCGMGMEVVVNEAWNFLLDTKPLFWSDGLG